MARRYITAFLFQREQLETPASEDSVMNQDSRNDQAARVSTMLGLYKAEWLDSKLFEFFNEPTYFGQLQTQRPCVLIGGRGTGKTTVLRGLSYQGQLAFANHDKSTVPSWSYYGLYYRVNTNRVTAFRGPELPEEKWIACFAHYINLSFCQLMLDFVHWYEHQTNQKIELSAAHLRTISAKLGIKGVRTLAELAEEIEFQVADFEASINTISDNYPAKLSLQGAPIDALADALMSTKELAGKQFFILIDEFENFEDYQQRVLNTLIKHATSSYTFKIGVRELGWRQRATLNPNEQLTSPADYARISIADVLDTSRFSSFAERVVLNRISNAYNMHGEVNVDLRLLLPSLPEMEEASKLMGKDVPAKLIHALKESLSTDELEQAAQLKPGELYFLHYWSENHNAVPFAQSVKEWLSGSKEWRTRLENHFHAMLFSIRKGKSGIRKYYVGWDVYVTLANGNIRYLLELVHNAFLRHIEDGGVLLEPISHENQTSAAEEVGKKNLSELEGLSVDGAKLTKLLLSVGRVFQVLADDPAGHAPEVNQFHLKEGDTSEELQRVKEILNQAVMHLALVRFSGTKPMDEADTKEYDYMIHPVFAPFFVFSHRRKRRLSFDVAQIIGLIERPRETIREILTRNNRRDVEVLPDQLQLFGSYYEGN
jgi:hypothetical protein